MTGFYDFEVFKKDWLVVFVGQDNSEIVVWNDPAILKKALERFDCLVGFNNYAYDDLILTGIMSGYNNYEIWKLSNAIVNDGNKITNTGHKTRIRP